MTNIFADFRRKFIPVVNWKFFSSIKEGKGLYNADSMPVWNDEWKPIAGNELGDVIIIKDNSIYEIQHDTGETKPALVTKHIEKLSILFDDLIKYKGFSEKDSIDILKDKKLSLKELKKQAPRYLKYNFELEIENIQETISDKRWSKTKAGQRMKTHEDFIKLVYPELRKNGRYTDVMIGRHPDKKLFKVFGWLKEGETEEEIKQIISKFQSPYPLEYGEFKPYDED